MVLSGVIEDGPRPKRDAPYAQGCQFRNYACRKRRAAYALRPVTQFEDDPVSCAFVFPSTEVPYFPEIFQSTLAENDVHLRRSISLLPRLPQNARRQVWCQQSPMPGGNRLT